MKIDGRHNFVQIAVPTAVPSDAKPKDCLVGFVLVFQRRAHIVQSQTHSLIASVERLRAFISSTTSAARSSRLASYSCDQISKSWSSLCCFSESLNSATS